MTATTCGVCLREIHGTPQEFRYKADGELVDVEHLCEPCADRRRNVIERLREGGGALYFHARDRDDEGEGK